MRGYVCPQLHILKYESHAVREIYCKQCNKWISKFDAYVFQFDKRMGRYYLSRQGPKPIEQLTRNGQWRRKNKERINAGIPSGRKAKSIASILMEKNCQS